MKQPPLFDVPPMSRELDSPARSFQRETAMERRWRLRQEAARERAERTVVAEIDHDPRWARPHSGYRVETIRDPRLDEDAPC